MHEYIEADNRMNVLYQIIMGIYEKSADDTGAYNKAELVKAQTAWLAYRNLAAKAETPGGEDFVYYRNMAELTQQRVDRLKRLLHYLNSGMSGRDSGGYESLATEGLAKYEAMEKSDKLNEPDPEKLNYEARRQGRRMGN